MRYGGDDRAAFAANWWVVLLVEALMALAVLAAGLVFALSDGAWWAWTLATLGAVYVFFVGGRAARWARLRRSAQ